MPTFPGLNEDCSDAILVMLDKATLLHVGSTSRIAFVAVGPHLVKKAVIVGSAAKISAFCSFVLSRRLMCQIRELYIRYTADETQARFVLSTASIATPLAKVLQGAKMLQSFTMREYAIYMFRYEPQLRDLLQKVPSLVSLDIWGPSMTAFDDLPCVGGLQSLSVCMPWKEDPQQYPALARFISTSAETLTQVDLHHTLTCLPIADPSKIIFPRLHVLKIRGPVPALSMKRLVEVFPNIHSLTICIRRTGPEDLFSTLESSMGTWPFLTTINVSSRLVLVFARLYQHMLRDITIPPDIFENVAHCEEWLNAIGSCPVVKRLSFETCFPSITDALASFVAAHPSVTTIAWLFASIASAIPHLRILALIVEIEFELGYLDEFVTAGVVQDALATLTQLDCLFLEIRAIGDLRNVDFDAPSCHFAQKMFKASSIQFLQLKLCSDLQGSGPTQCWQRSSISNGYNASRLDILKVSTDEYNDAERRVLEEN